MFPIKEPLVRGILSLVFLIGLVTGAHAAVAQNSEQPNAFNSNTNPNQNSNFNPNPFLNPYLFVNPPDLVQPSIVGIPSVSPNAIGITDPLGNPYPFLNPNPITNPNVVTPSVTPNSSTLPNQGIGANPTGRMSNLPNTTGIGIVVGVAPTGGAGNPSGAGRRELDQIVE
jgi:hypothetical protein